MSYLLGEFDWRLPLARCETFDVHYHEQQARGLIFQLKVGVPLPCNPQKRKHAVEALLEEQAAVMRLTVPPIVAVTKDGAIAIYFQSLEPCCIGEDQRFSCVELASGIVSSFRQAANSKPQQRSWFELDPALFCLEGGRIVLVALPLLTQQTAEQQFEAMKKTLRSMIPTNVPDKILLRKVEQCANMEELEREVAYFSKLGRLGSRNKSHESAVCQTKQTTRRRKENLLTFLNNSSKLSRRSPATSSLRESATLHEQLCMQWSDSHRPFRLQASGQALLEKLRMKRCMNNRDEHMANLSICQSFVEKKDNNWIAENHVGSNSIVLKSSKRTFPMAISRQFDMLFRPDKLKLSLASRQLMVVIRPRSWMRSLQLCKTVSITVDSSASNRVQRDRPTSSHVKPICGQEFKQDVTTEEFTMQPSRVQSKQPIYQPLRPQSSNNPTNKPNYQSPQNKENITQEKTISKPSKQQELLLKCGPSSNKKQSRDTPSKHEQKPPKTATAEQPTKLTATDSTTKGDKPNQQPPPSTSANSQPKPKSTSPAVTAFNNKLDCINVLGQTVAMASSLFKTFDEPIFWQLPLFFIYKYFLHHRTLLVERVPKTERAQLTALAKENALLNSSIEQSLRKMLAVVLTRNEKEPYAEFEVGSYLNLNFTQSFWAVTHKLVCQHLSYLLEKHYRNIQVVRYGICLMDSLLMIHRGSMVVDEHKRVLQLEGKQLYEQLNSRIDLVEGMETRKN